jgi:hypothetical protein
VLPIDGKADVQIAKILDGIIRHIEYNSHAEIAYDTATEFAVQGGHRLLARGDRVRARRLVRSGNLHPPVKNPHGLSRSGHSIRRRRDAKFGFVFEDMSERGVRGTYPGEIAARSCFPVGGHGGAWLGKDRIRIAEYFRKSTKTDTLIAHPSTARCCCRSWPDERAAAIEADRRSSAHGRAPVITWYKIAGDKVIDESEWPGRYIPIVRVVGEEIDIDGKIERKGHTCAAERPAAHVQLHVVGAGRVHRAADENAICRRRSRRSKASNRCGRTRTRKRRVSALQQR